MWLIFAYLNTSHVKVKLTYESSVPANATVFKYISC